MHHILENMKVVSIIIVGLLFLGMGHLLLVDGADTSLPMQAALWGAACAGVVLYWPHRTTLQLLSLCWLGIALCSIAALALADCSVPSDEISDLPSSMSLLIILTVPFLMVLLPLVLFTIRSAYRDHMRTILEESVLAATDTLHGPVVGAMEKALQLLSDGTRADFIADAMVQRDEDNFEAITTPNPEAIENALVLIPLLGNAGATITQDSLESAKYNCQPSVQAALRQLPHA